MHYGVGLSLEEKVLQFFKTFVVILDGSKQGIPWYFVRVLYVTSCNKLMREANTYTYMELLDKLNLWTLEERRNHSDLIEVFKMAKNLSPIPLTKFFELNTDNRTRGHSFKLVKHCCNCKVRRHRFD